jgi:hypothetical protein
MALQCNIGAVRLYFKVPAVAEVPDPEGKKISDRESDAA